VSVRSLRMRLRLVRFCNVFSDWQALVVDVFGEVCMI